MKKLAALPLEAYLLILALAFLLAGTLFAVAHCHWSSVSVAVALLAWGAGTLYVVWSEHE